MKDTDRQLLIDLRHALLHLHKTLLEWERAAYEKIHGRTSPGNLLTALMNDAQFAWLRPLSELIVRIDESLEIDGILCLPCEDFLIRLIPGELLP